MLIYLYFMKIGKILLHWHQSAEPNFTKFIQKQYK